MCDCITEIEKKALTTLREQQKTKKPVASVRMRGVAFPMVGNKLTTRTCNMLEVELVGQKRSLEMSMFHSFCPFCGEKYETA
jgi:hypothetical protein